MVGVMRWFDVALSPLVVLFYIVVIEKPNGLIRCVVSIRGHLKCLMTPLPVMGKKEYLYGSSTGFIIITNEEFGQAIWK